MPEPTAIGLLIRQRRETARLSRPALARKAGISESTLKNIETGRHEPARTTLEGLAVALDMPGLVGPAPAVVGLLERTGPQMLADLLRQYSTEVLAVALRLSGADLLALMTVLFPVSAELAQQVARLDLAALAAEQGGGHGG